MKAPWADKTGLAKWTAFFLTTLIVATGLCGVSVITANALHSASRSKLLLFTVEIEAVVMALSLAALVGALLWVALASLVRSFPGKDRQD